MPTQNISPPTPNHPHSPIKNAHKPPTTQTIPPHTPNHPHPPIKNVHKPPPTQNIPPPITNHPHPPIKNVHLLPYYPHPPIKNVHPPTRTHKKCQLTPHQPKNNLLPLIKNVQLTPPSQNISR